jgi:hypothetical protein
MTKSFRKWWKTTVNHVSAETNAAVSGKERSVISESGKTSLQSGLYVQHGWPLAGCGRSCYSAVVVPDSMLAWPEKPGDKIKQTSKKKGALHRPFLHGYMFFTSHPGFALL